MHDVEPSIPQSCLRRVLTLPGDRCLMRLVSRRRGSNVGGPGRSVSRLCGPALNLSGCTTLIFQRSKPLGPQPPAEMIYPCPPSFHIPHSDSLVVCFAHPSGLTQEGAMAKTHGRRGAGGLH